MASREKQGMAETMGNNGVGTLKKGPLLRDRLVRAVAGFMTRRPGVVLTAVVAFGAFFWSFAPRVMVRPDVDDFLPVHGSSFLLRRHVRDVFPNSEFVVVAFQPRESGGSPESGGSVFTPRALTVLQKVTEGLENLSTVRDVKSLANVTDMVGEEDAFTVGPFLETIPESPGELDALKKRALENPLFRDHLVSRDGRTAALVVFTLDNPTIPDYRGQLVRDVRSVLAPFAEQGDRFHLAGWPVTNFFLAETMNRDLARFVPLVLLVVTGVLWWVFRSVRLLVLAIAGILATVAATLGLSAALNVTLNNASAAVVPIVMALALSDIVHVYSHLSRDVLDQCPGRRNALRHVLEQVLFPCFLTSVNTSIGFLSLSMSGIPAIQTFGVLAASGMFFEFIFTFGFVTPLLLLFRPETIYRDVETHQQRLLPRLVKRNHDFVLRHPAMVLFVCLAALAWGGWQSRLVTTDTNLFEWFHHGSTLRDDLEFVKSRLAGVMPADIFIESDIPGRLRDPDVLEAIDRLKGRLIKTPNIDTVVSVVDYYKEMNKSFFNEDPSYYRVPASRRMVDQYRLLYNADELQDYVTGDDAKGRMILRFHGTSTKENSDTLRRIESELSDVRVPGVRFRVAGDVPVHVETTKVLVGEQVQNVVSAVVTIWIVMVVVLRSLSLAGVFLAPNLFPIIINFGVMGSLGIALDSGTSLTAAAAFGVIVDDTVHFFIRFRELRQAGGDYFEALRLTTLEKGEACATSFLTMCAGYGVLTLSGFRPITYFGFLNLLVLAVGFVGDQWFLKSMMVLWGRFKGMKPSLS